MSSFVHCSSRGMRCWWGVTMAHQEVTLDYVVGRCLYLLNEGPYIEDYQLSKGELGDSF